MRLEVVEVSTGNVLGTLDDEHGEPRGTGIYDEMLARSRRGRRGEFEHLAEGGGNNGYRMFRKVGESKDVHSQVATHTVGYGIGTVVASQSNTEETRDKKRKRKRLRRLAYRRHSD